MKRFAIMVLVMVLMATAAFADGFKNPEELDLAPIEELIDFDNETLWFRCAYYFHGDTDIDADMSDPNEWYYMVVYAMKETWDEAHVAYVALYKDDGTFIEASAGYLIREVTAETRMKTAMNILEYFNATLEDETTGIYPW